MYYNYQQAGHNVFLLGENETGGSTRGKRAAMEKPLFEFDPHVGPPGPWI